MFARITSGTLFRPDRFDEVKTAFETGAVYGMRAHKGFQKAYLLQATDNPAEAMLIALWDSRESAEAAEKKADYLIQTQKVMLRISGKQRKSYELVSES